MQGIHQAFKDMSGVAGILSASSVEPVLLDCLTKGLANSHLEGQGRKVAGNVGLPLMRPDTIDTVARARTLYNEAPTLVLTTKRAYAAISCFA